MGSRDAEEDVADLEFGTSYNITLYTNWLLNWCNFKNTFRQFGCVGEMIVNVVEKEPDIDIAWQLHRTSGSSANVASAEVAARADCASDLINHLFSNF